MTGHRRRAVVRQLLQLSPRFATKIPSQLLLPEPEEMAAKAAAVAGVAAALARRKAAPPSCEKPLPD